VLDVGKFLTQKCQLQIAHHELRAPNNIEAFSGADAMTYDWVTTVGALAAGIILGLVIVTAGMREGTLEWPLRRDC